MISSEALVGIGITVAELGLLCLMLALAERLRSLPKIAVIWLGLGAALVIVGGLTVAFARSRDRRPVRVDRIPASDVEKDETETASESEEQLF